MKKDYFRILGVHKNATKTDIRDAYESLKSKLASNVASQAAGYLSQDIEQAYICLNKIYRLTDKERQKEHIYGPCQSLAEDDDTARIKAAIIDNETRIIMGNPEKSDRFLLLGLLAILAIAFALYFWEQRPGNDIDAKHGPIAVKTAMTASDFPVNLPRRDSSHNETSIESYQLMTEEERMNSANSYYQFGRRAIDRHDFCAAIKYFTYAAELGHADASYETGIMHREGKCAAKSVSEAEVWLLKASEGGNRPSNLALAEIYARGGRNMSKAVAYYEKAFDSGIADAGNKLGLIYFTGHGVPSDHLKARAIFAKAASNGSSYAKYHLGYMMERGFGGRKDASGAFELYRQAAEQEVPEAQYVLGTCYRDGIIAKQNFLNAKYWLDRASKNGYGEADFALGEMWERGIGFPRNRVRATEAYGAACAKGVQKACSKIR